MTDLTKLKSKLKKLMLETDLKIWNYFLGKAEINTKLNCPLCGGVGTFCLAQNGFNPKELLGSCQVSTCAFHGSSEHFVQRFTRLTVDQTRRVLRLFEGEATVAEITKEINKEIKAQADERKRTFRD